MVTDKQFSRLFFALWPSNQVRQSIVDVFSAIAIPDHSCVLQPENLHITLHFLGQVESDRKVCIQQVACALNDKPFVVNLDCLGYFTKAKIFQFILLDCDCIKDAKYSVAPASFDITEIFTIISLLLF